MYDNVIKFIEETKKKHPLEIADTFSNGFCYWYAVILCIRFKGEIWFNPYIVHFAAKIGDYLYDVNGMLDDTYGWQPWERYQLSHHYECVQIIRSVINKEK